MNKKQARDLVSTQEVSRAIISTPKYDGSKRFK